MGDLKTIFGGRWGYSGGKVRWAQKNPPVCFGAAVSFCLSLFLKSLQVFWRR